ncbi:MAG: type II toxin-antitoxin system RelE family toxin, partial [Gammaproteobacteria bacterium]
MHRPRLLPLSVGYTHRSRRSSAAPKRILSNPLCGKALKDELDGLRSFRVGRFRIVYRIAAGRVVELVA